MVTLKVSCTKLIFLFIFFLKEKTKSLLQQYEDVSHLNSERSARLERAQVLLGQFWETYEELSPWIEEMQTTISQLPPPAVDHDMLRQQQEEIRVGHLIFFFAHKLCYL